MGGDLETFLAIFFGSFVSEDLALIGAGTLAANGTVGMPFALAASFAGIFIGDLLLFFAGRSFGRRIVKVVPFRWMFSEATLERGSELLNRNGRNAVFLCRLTPGLRLPVYFAAGALKTDTFKFVIYFAIAAALWTPIIVAATAYICPNIVQSALGDNTPLAVVTLLALYLTFRLFMKVLTWRGRRSLVGFWKRWTSWEFWPIWLFYVPIVFHFLGLSIRYRSISVFADANPAIPLGGFVGESKIAIYVGLSRSGFTTSFLLDHTHIPYEASLDSRITIARDFIAGRSFPVVLKPDVGERGSNVHIIHSEKDLFAAVNDPAGDLILQEYCGGAEFSVFYYRLPSEKHGQIYSITEKKFPTLIGNGRSTIEELILGDRRAVAIANKYLERNKSDLDHVPGIGETVQIIDIGTHSKGAIFLDGAWARTEKLESTIDAICRDYPGFYFGRFDLRARSVEEFKNGQFKIIELNGVSSESTNIYDPTFSLVKAYGILFRQWSIAFEIGHQNRLKGKEYTSPKQLARSILTMIS